MLQAYYMYLHGTQLPASSKLRRMLLNKNVKELVYACLSGALEMTTMLCTSPHSIKWQLFEKMPVVLGFGCF